jgi:hypothetical protein
LLGYSNINEMGVACSKVEERGCAYRIGKYVQKYPGLRWNRCGDNIKIDVGT